MVTVLWMALERVLVEGKLEASEEYEVLEELGRLVGLDLNQIVPGMGQGLVKERKGELARKIKLFQKKETVNYKTKPSLLVN